MLTTFSYENIRLERWLHSWTTDTQFAPRHNQYLAATFSQVFRFGSEGRGRQAGRGRGASHSVRHFHTDSWRRLVSLPILAMAIANLCTRKIAFNNWTWTTSRLIKIRLSLHFRIGKHKNGEEHMSGWTGRNGSDRREWIAGWLAGCIWELPFNSHRSIYVMVIYCIIARHVIVWPCTYCCSFPKTNSSSFSCYALHCTWPDDRLPSQSTWATARVRDRW